MPLLVLLALLGTVRASQSASSATTVVSATVGSMTTLDTTGCTGGSLALGPLTVGSSSVTAAPCNVSFSSNNDTAMLRLHQTDRHGEALTAFDPSGTRRSGANDYEGLTARDDSEAWAVGVARRTGNPTPITHTTDGGATWQMQTACHTNTALQDVDHVAGSTVVAVGKNGTICRTIDGGDVWTTVTSPSSGHWYGLSVRPDGLGWLVGAAGRVAASTDGGASWSSLPVVDPSYTISEVVAASSTQLYATAFTMPLPRSAFLLSSSDGGVSWNSFPVPGLQPTGWAYGLTSIDASTAIATTSVGKFRTADGGSTWTLVDGQSALCVTSAGSTVLAFNSPGGTVRRSLDGGLTWSTSPDPDPFTGQIWACDSSTATTVWATGFNDQRMRSTDAGDTYDVAPTDFRDLEGVAAWSTTDWVAVGDSGAVRRSEDGGVTVDVSSAGTSEHLTDVVAARDDTAVAIGEGGTIVRSTDRGVSWSAIDSGTTVSLLDADRSPDGDLYAVGSSILLRSRDDGLTWTDVGGVPASLTAVAAAADGRIYAGATDGSIHRSDDHGATWTVSSTATSLRIRSIDTADGANVLATTFGDVMGDCALVRSTDAGVTSAVARTITSSCYAVQFQGSSIVSIGIGSGYMRSTDGGATWSTHSAMTNPYALAVVDTHTIVLAGQGDVITTVTPSASIGNVTTGVGLAGGTSVFGGCVESSAGTDTDLWPVAGSGNCTAANTGSWRPVAAEPTDTTGPIATTAIGDVGQVALRFGARPAAGQAPLDYTAQLTWVVVAPSP